MVLMRYSPSEDWAEFEYCGGKFRGDMEKDRLQEVKVPQVALGTVRWIAPTGLVGLTPLASIGPVSVGPGTSEGSTAILPEVLIRLDPLQSLVHRRLMLQLHADKAEVGDSSLTAYLNSLQKRSISGLQVKEE